MPRLPSVTGNGRDRIQSASICKPLPARIGSPKKISVFQSDQRRNAKASAAGRIGSKRLILRNMLLADR